MSLLAPHSPHPNKTTTTSTTTTIPTTTTTTKSTARSKYPTTTRFQKLPHAILHFYTVLLVFLPLLQCIHSLPSFTLPQYQESDDNDHTPTTTTTLRHLDENIATSTVHHHLETTLNSILTELDPNRHVAFYHGTQSPEFSTRSTNKPPSSSPVFIDVNEQIQANMLGYEQRFFAIPAHHRARTLTIQTLHYGDELSVHLSQQYRLYPDRDYSFQHLKNLSKLHKDPQREDPNGRLEIPLPEYALLENENWDLIQPANLTMELRIDKVLCQSPTNSSCAFQITMVEHQPPVLYIMLGVLGGVALFALCAMGCFSLLFCVRDCISKRNAKKRKKLEAEKEELEMTASVTSPIEPFEGTMNDFGHNDQEMIPRKTRQQRMQQQHQLESPQHGLSSGTTTDEGEFVSPMMQAQHQPQQQQHQLYSYMMQQQQRQHEYNQNGHSQSMRMPQLHEMQIGGSPPQRATTQQRNSSIVTLVNDQSRVGGNFSHQMNFTGQ